MEKAILKTLSYADIFDYPLTLYEIHKWLVGRKANLRQIEVALLLLSKKGKVKTRGGYYFLGQRKELVSARKKKKRQSAAYLRKARVLASILKIIPWIKLVGISGGLAMENAQKGDDIDFFIITSNNLLWSSRLFALGVLSLTGQRRKAGETGRKIAGKICVNTLLEEDKLEQRNKDIYLAHEVLQMRVLWERDGSYQKYLEDNSWAFKYLPNWVGSSENSSLRGVKRRSNLGMDRIATSLRIAMTMEKLAKWFQLKIMQPPTGLERIQDGALYFHPKDCRQEILAKFKKKISRFNSGTS